MFSNPRSRPTKPQEKRPNSIINGIAGFLDAIQK
jgi:hypothetical protein